VAFLLETLSLKLNDESKSNDLKFSEGFIVNFKLLMFVSYTFWKIFSSIFIVINFTDIPGFLLCRVDPCKSRINSYLCDALSKLIFAGELKGLWNERRRSESP
jgi:hypothetical protein